MNENSSCLIDSNIWWNEQIMTDKSDSFRPISLKKKLYLAPVNQGEASYEINKKRHDTLHALIKKRAEGSLNVQIKYFENESHRSIPLIAL